MKIFRTDRERMRRLHAPHISRHTKESDAARHEDSDPLQWKVKPVGEHETRTDSPTWTATSEASKV